eukprot:m.110559 g.110559  ORF g.110559 m.110559 type:complete len:711 (-) comp14043_c0_seq3:1689-3821(-)
MADKETKVKVAVRCRPLNDKEKGDGHTSVIKMDTRSGTVSVQNPDKSKGIPPKEFTFDMCFDWDAKQLDIYNRTARDIVNACLQGYNGTIFAYGQTGTGKTHTMEGVRGNPELQGIIPNSFAHIFGEIMKSEGSTRFLVRCSYLEIYCEDVRDLLGNKQNEKLQVKESPDSGVYVKDLTTFVVRNADDMDKIMTKGNVNRKVGETKMNARSSRSHAIFTVTIERSDKGADGADAIRVGKLNLVDLAGSERQGKTGAEGQRLTEATKINMSLSTLGNVISALVDGKSTHVPYRDSKLTRLLQDSLGGNARTVMIANFGPADYNYEETITTLRYADRAKRIKNKPKINENPKDALLREMQEQIEKLKKQLADGDGGESSGTDDSSDDGEEIVGPDGEKRIRKKKKKGGRMSPSKIDKIKEEIEAEKKQLKAQTDMAVEEKARVEAELAKKEATVEKARQERLALEKKMEAVQGKLIVGGVNLLEKAQEQELLLEESQRELEKRMAAEEALHSKIRAGEEEQINIEEQYKSLEDEIAGKTKKIKKIYQHLMSAKSEIEELQRERSQQTEAMLDNIRELSRELRLSMLIIDSYIPPEFQDQIEQRSTWNEEIGEWEITGVAYTGNNMNKTAEKIRLDDELDRPRPLFELDLEKQYFIYGSLTDDARPPKTARPKTGKSRRTSSKSEASRSKSKSESSKEIYPESRPTTAKSRFA